MATHYTHRVHYSVAHPHTHVTEGAEMRVDVVGGTVHADTKEYRHEHAGQAADGHDADK